MSYIQSEGLEQVAKHGWEEPELRAEVEQEYLELENSLEIYEDPLLQDYLNQLLLRIYPGELPERHTANLRVHLFNGSEPVSLGCSNGNIYLSTGLLSTLGSEAELMAMLAVEVAHCSPSLFFCCPAAWLLPSSAVWAWITPASSSKKRTGWRSWC